MPHSKNIVKFYSKELSDIQKNARKIMAHPVFSNVDHIRSQVNDLKQAHRRFIFAYLSKRYGEFKARDLAQTDEVKAIVDNFEDLDGRIVERLDSMSENDTLAPNLLLKLKTSYYHQEKAPSTIRREFLMNMKEKAPDLIHMPKEKKVNQARKRKTA